MVDESGHDGTEIALAETQAVQPARRRALWGVLAVVALVTGGVVALSPDDDGHPSRLPVSLGSTGGGRAESADAAASMLAWVTYVAGEGLPALGGEALAYRLEPHVRAERVRSLAAALGMRGEPTQVDQQWRLESGDAVLEVYGEGGGSWWYSATNGTVSVTSGSVEPCSTADERCAAESVADCPPDADCIGIPVEPVPTPPADLPSEAEARRIALDLLAATGTEISDAHVRVDGPHDAWSVEVTPRLAGRLVPGWTSTASIGSNGTILSASGTTALAISLEDYPLIDTRAAIDRLNQLQGAHRDLPVPLTPGGTDLHDPVVPPDQGACKVQPDGAEICVVPGGTVGATPEECGPVPAPAEPPVVPLERPIPEPQIADVPSEDTPATVPGEGPDAAVISPVPPPTDCEGWQPYPQPAPVEVVLTDAEHILTMLFANDGSGDVYLVPGYRLSNDEGAVVEVVAVEDDSLAGATNDPTPEVDGPDSAGPLDEGQEPEIGVGYYVEVLSHCATMIFDGRWWGADGQTGLPWAEPTEGGTFTLTSRDDGRFVGDAEGKRSARFTAQGPAEEIPGCA